MAFDKQYLNMLGFSLKSNADQLALADVAGKARKDRSVTTDEVVVVHCCCEKGQSFFLNRLKAKE